MNRSNSQSKNKVDQSGHNCAICTVKIVPSFPKLYPRVSCISSLCPAWERGVRGSCQIWGWTDLLVGMWAIAKSYLGTERAWATIRHSRWGIPPSNLEREKFWSGHLVEDILLVAAVQLLHGGEELIGSNSSDHLVPENADDCLNNSIYVV